MCNIVTEFYVWKYMSISFYGDRYSKNLLSSSEYLVFIQWKTSGFLTHHYEDSFNFSCESEMPAGPGREWYLLGLTSIV